MRKPKYIRLLLAVMIGMALLIVGDVWVNGRRLANGYSMVSIFGSTYVIVSPDHEIFAGPSVIKIGEYGSYVLGLGESHPIYSEEEWPGRSGYFIIGTRDGTALTGLSHDAFVHEVVRLGITEKPTEIVLRRAGLVF